MDKARFKAAVFPRLNAIPTILSINKLVKAITQVATSLKTRMWRGGLHGCLALILDETEMRHVANKPALNCDRMDRPPFTHLEITPLTTVTDEKQLTNKHKVTWDKYHLQESIIFHGRAAFVAAVIPQYIEEKKVDYLGYGNKTIFSLVTHLRTRPVITSAESMATKSAFIAPWSDSLNQHISAYSCDLTREQNNAKEYEVNITDDNKLTQLVACIYEANILKNLVIEKWEEAGDRDWTNTVKQFVKEYGVVTRAAERAAQRAGFDSAAALSEHDRSSTPPINSPPPASPRPSTEDYNAMTAYEKALE